MLQEVVTTAHDCSYLSFREYLDYWGMGGWREEDPKKVSVSCDADLSYEMVKLTELKD